MASNLSSTTQIRLLSHPIIIFSGRTIHVIQQSLHDSPGRELVQIEIRSSEQSHSWWKQEDGPPKNLECPIHEPKSVCTNRINSASTDLRVWLTHLCSSIVRIVGGEKAEQNSFNVFTRVPFRRSRFKRSRYLIAWNDSWKWYIQSHQHHAIGVSLHSFCFARNLISCGNRTPIRDRQSENVPLVLYALATRRINGINIFIKYIHRMRLNCERYGDLLWVDCWRWVASSLRCSRRFI